MSTRACAMEKECEREPHTPTCLSRHPSSFCHNTPCSPKSRQQKNKQSTRSLNSSLPPLPFPFPLPLTHHANDDDDDNNNNNDKQLREKTGAPLMDVKKALSATGFDMEAAYAELRKRGLAVRR